MSAVQSTDERSFDARMLGATALAAGVHAVVLWVLAWSISFSFTAPEVRPPEIVALVKVPPPPPEVRALGPTEAITTMPLFRPRTPLGLTSEQQERYGDPRLAIWKYLCNRDESLSEAVRIGCPAPNFGAVDMGSLAPLNRQGDAGVLLGADAKTMTLDEAAIARGWMKKPPQAGQSGLSGKTDRVDQPDGPELFKSLPTLKHPGENAPPVN